VSSTTGVVKEFSEASERYEKAKAKMYGAVLKYLLAASTDPSRCTEAGIMDGLSLPRSIARTILSEYEKEGILACRDVGKSKPYEVVDLRKAIMCGYVTFDRKEFEDLVGPVEVEAGADGKTAAELLTPNGVGKDLDPWFQAAKRPDGRDVVVGNRPTFPHTYKAHTYALASQIQMLNPSLKRLHQLQSRIMASATMDSLLAFLPHLRQAFCLLWPYTADMSWESVDARRRLTKDLISCFDRDSLPDPATLPEDEILGVARKLFVQKTKRDIQFLEPFIDLVENKGKAEAVQILQGGEQEKTPHGRGQEDRILREDLWAVSMGLDSQAKMCRLLQTDRETLRTLESVRTRLDKIIEYWE